MNGECNVIRHATLDVISVMYNCRKSNLVLLFIYIFVALVIGFHTFQSTEQADENHDLTRLGRRSHTHTHTQQRERERERGGGPMTAQFSGVLTCYLGFHVS